MVPGKVEDFLSVLYEFESNSEGRTAMELFERLKPVLSDWPELLRDFAAFLHPEQAQECGLVREKTKIVLCLRSGMRVCHKSCNDDL